jgi:hypothetical protein
LLLLLLLLLCHYFCSMQSIRSRGKGNVINWMSAILMMYRINLQVFLGNDENCYEYNSITK